MKKTTRERLDDVEFDAAQEFRNASDLIDDLKDRLDQLEEAFFSLRDDEECDESLKLLKLSALKRALLKTSRQLRVAVNEVTTVEFRLKEVEDDQDDSGG